MDARRKAAFGNDSAGFRKRAAQAMSDGVYSTCIGITSLPDLYGFCFNSSA
jgi:hypothetical protein